MSPRLRAAIALATLAGAAGVALTFAAFRTELLRVEARRPAPRAAARAAEPGSALAQPTTNVNTAPTFTLSSYQSDVTRPTLQVLDGLERSARERGEAALLASIQTERTRVLRAAIGLPRTAPERHQERNDP